MLLYDLEQLYIGSSSMKREILALSMLIVLIVSVVGGLAFAYSKGSTETQSNATENVRTTTITESMGTNGTFTYTVEITSTESTTINGLLCTLSSDTRTLELHYGGGGEIPNSSYIAIIPYFVCWTTETLDGTSYVTSYSNSTSGNWTLHVFPTATYTETEYVENYSTTVTLK
jgi:hypothetical protein